MFHLYLPGEDRKLSGRGSPFEVNPVIYGDAWLKLRHFYQRITHIASHSLQLVRALPGRPHRPAFHSHEDEGDDARDDENHERKGERPGKAPPKFWVRIHNVMSPKKYRPPRPMDVKGGCSPQNIL